MRPAPEWLLIVAYAIAVCIRLNVSTQLGISARYHRSPRDSEPEWFLCPKKTQYPLIKEYALKYRGLNIMV